MVGNGPTASEMGLTEQDQTGSPATEDKGEKHTFGAKLINSTREKARDVLQRLRGPKEIAELNPTANSYITPEAEDQQLVEEFSKVSPLEKQAAVLQEQLQQSALPTLDLFPPEYAEILLKSQQAFDEMFTRMTHGKRFEQGDPALKIVAPSDTYNDTNGSVFGNHVSTPKEFDLTFLAEARKLFQFTLLQTQDPNTINSKKFSAGSFLETAIQRAEETLQAETENTKIVDELKSGDHYLSHGVSPKALETVLTSGYICSRQSQLDRFGKAYFASFGMDGGSAIEYPDRVEQYWPTGELKTVFNPNEELGGQSSKGLSDHRYEVLLEADGLYHPDSVSFVFPGAELLQDTKYYKGDGVYIYSKDYDPDTNKQGFEISLKDQPHLVVTTRKNSDQLLNFIAQAEWIEDKDGYIRDNVVILDDIDKGTIMNEKLRINNQVRETAQKQFAGLSYPDLGQHIVPTAVFNKSDEVNGNKPSRLFKRV